MRHGSGPRWAEPPLRDSRPPAEASLSARSQAHTPSPRATPPSTGSHSRLSRLLCAWLSLCLILPGNLPGATRGEPAPRATAQASSPTTKGSSGPIAPDSPAAQAVIQDAMAHVLLALDSYSAGDFPNARQELDIALDTLLPTGIFREDEGLRLLGRYLPPAYQGFDLVKVYKEASRRKKAVEAVAENRLPEEKEVGGPQGAREPIPPAPGEEASAARLPRPPVDAASIQQKAPVAGPSVPPPPQYLPEEDMAFVRGEIERIVAAFGEKTYPHPEIFEQQVAWFIRVYQTQLNGWFNRSLMRSAKYMPMVQATLREKGVPGVMAYIAFVESGFRSTAVSNVGAVGLWQFMPKTARAYGLKVDRAIDDRQDPQKATVAAREYFLDLVAIFGSSSFLLAMASYNAGEGKVQYCLKQVDDPFTQRTFWDIRSCLRQETREYIPRIIAAAIIAQAPERFGFGSIKEFLDPERYQAVQVPFPASLSLLASLSGVSVDALRAMNPELGPKDTTTPKLPAPYWLLVPAARKDAVEEELTTILARKQAEERLAAEKAKAEAKVAAKPEAAKPETGKPEAGKPEAGKPEAGKLEPARPENGKAEGKPESGKAETAKVPEKVPAKGEDPSSHPDIPPPEAAKPEAGKTETGRAEQARTEPPPADKASLQASRATTGSVSSSPPQPTGPNRPGEPPRTDRSTAPDKSPSEASTLTGDTRPASASGTGPGIDRAAPTPAPREDVSSRPPTPEAKPNGVAATPGEEGRDPRGTPSKPGSDPTKAAPDPGKASSKPEAAKALEPTGTAKSGSSPRGADPKGNGSKSSPGSSSLAKAEPASDPDADAERRSRFVRYSVQERNTLSQIALDFGTTQARLKEWNPYLSRRELQAGDTVFIYDVGPELQKLEHVVKKGDTLPALAKKYAVGEQALQRWNGLKTSSLPPGSKVIVYTRQAPVVSKSAGSPATPGATKPSKRNALTYEVQSGNNLSMIAAVFDVDFRDIMKWNDLSSGRIQAGQKLVIYPTSKMVLEQYTAKKGDTLPKLAKRLDLEVAYLCAVNGLDEGTPLKSGQVLKIYRKVK